MTAMTDKMAEGRRAVHAANLAISQSILEGTLHAMNIADAATLAASEKSIRQKAVAMMVQHNVSPRRAMELAGFNYAHGLGVFRHWLASDREFRMMFENNVRSAALIGIAQAIPAMTKAAREWADPEMARGADKAAFHLGKISGLLKPDLAATTVIENQQNIQINQQIAGMTIEELQERFNELARTNRGAPDIGQSPRGNGADSGRAGEAPQEMSARLLQAECISEQAAPEPLP